MVKTKVRKKTRPALNEEDRRKAVEEAAYYRWQGRGGEHGRDLDDWMDAEEEVAQNVFDRDPED